MAIDKNSEKYRWDLTQFFSGLDDPEILRSRKKVEIANRNFINKWEKRKDYLEDPKILRSALDELEKIEAEYSQYGDEGIYLFLLQSTNLSDPDIKAKYNSLSDFETKLSNDLSFFAIKLSKISEGKQEEFLKAKELSPYKHYLEKLFAAGKYILTEAEEKILNIKSKTSHENWSTLRSKLFATQKRKIVNEEGKTVELTFEELQSKCSSINKKVRDQSNKRVNEIINSLEDVTEAEINSILENKKNDDELRGYRRVDSSRLQSDDINEEIVDTLINSVTNRNDISHRYYTLKRKLLKVKTLKYHERNVPYTLNEILYPYNKAVKVVKNTFNKLDPQFLEVFELLEKNRRIDVSPREGKRGGAFMASFIKNRQGSIMLNYGDSTRDVTILAHEMGHAINSSFINKNENGLQVHYPMCTAEVSSTFFEEFVLDEIAGTMDDANLLSLIMEKLNDDISTVFRQAAFYKFEFELHTIFREVGYLGKEKINELFQKHMNNYLGDTVLVDKEHSAWWTYVGHFRMFFYVYSYAFGLLVSKALQSMVKEDHQNIDKVKKFLSTGSSKSPQDIFAELDIDITDPAFWNKGLDQVDLLLTEAERIATERKLI